MSQATWRHRYTLRDYLDVEEVSVVRHELIDGEIVAMAGGTPEHAALASAISALLGGQLRGQPCRSYSADLRIRVEALRAYVLVAQDKRRVELWSRSTASGEWAYAVYRPGEQVPLESIGCRLDLNDLYSAAGVPATGS